VEESGTLGEWQIRYHKGLGTSTGEDGRAYMPGEQCVARSLTFRNPDADPEGADADARAIEAAFLPSNDSLKRLCYDQRSPRQAGNERKELIRQFRQQRAAQDQHFTEKVEVTIEDFVKAELAGYFAYDTERSFPSLMDGLKPS